ncbi:unnamed protein product, partial [Closterium sp. NIES-54]
MSAGGGGDGGGVEVLSSPHFTNHLRLPRVRCPRGGLSRGTVGSSPRMGRSRSSPRLASPRTPRRRTGRLSAGAAMAFFNTCRSPTSPTFATFFQLQQQLQQEIQQEFQQQQQHQQQQNGPLHAICRPLSPPIIDKPLAPGGSCGDGGGGGSSGASRSGVEAEYSAMVNEELLLFFYRMDLNARLERALQADQYEAAQELREKIAEIDRETARQRDAKAAISFASATPSPVQCANQSAAPTAAPSAVPSAAPSAAPSALGSTSNSGGGSSSSFNCMPPLVEDGPLSMQTLKEELQQVASGGKPGEEEAGAGRCRFQLGQRVQHCRHAYTAVVVGVDPVCCESAEWMAAADVAGLPRGPCQPFYQVLFYSADGGSFPVAYVAEDLLTLPSEPTT